VNLAKLPAPHCNRRLRLSRRVLGTRRAILGAVERDVRHITMFAVLIGLLQKVRFELSEPVLWSDH